MFINTRGIKALFHQICFWQQKRFFSWFEKRLCVVNMKVVIRVNKDCVFDFMNNQGALSQKWFSFFTLVSHSIFIHPFRHFLYQSDLGFCESQNLLSWKGSQCCCVNNSLFMKAINSCYSSDINIIVVFLAELWNVIVFGVVREWPNVNIVSTYYHRKFSIFWFLDLNESTNIKRKML